MVTEHKQEMADVEPGGDRIRSQMMEAAYGKTETPRPADHRHHRPQLCPWPGDGENGREAWGIRCPCREGRGRPRPDRCGHRSRGCTAVHVVADVAEEDQVQYIADVASELFGGFDTWVNNACVGVISYSNGKDG